jgi:hypothetical protein
LQVMTTVSIGGSAPGEPVGGTAWEGLVSTVQYSFRVRPAPSP